MTGDRAIPRWNNFYNTFSRLDTIPGCHGQTNGRTELLYQYCPLHSCVNAESCFKNIMHLRDRRCVLTLRPLFVYATASICLSVCLSVRPIACIRSRRVEQILVLKAKGQGHWENVKSSFVHILVKCRLIYIKSNQDKSNPPPILHQMHFTRIRLRTLGEEAFGATALQRQIRTFHMV